MCIDVYLREGFIEVKGDADVSYSDMKRIAKENGINSYGMSKEVLQEAIKQFI
jgi:predicted double-glycine peptidase